MYTIVSLWAGILEISTDFLCILGCIPFSQKMQKPRLKVKWNSNFPGNAFENCRLLPEVVLFFHSERNGRNYFLFPVSHQPKTIAENQIANGNP